MNEKKLWSAPGIEELSIEETFYDTLQGSAVDGQWLNHETCQWNDAYVAS